LDGSAKTFGPLSTADADQVHIRYTSSGSYEIELPGAAWDQLVFAKNAIPQDPATFNYFQPASAPVNGAYLITSVAKAQGFSYSEMAAWFDGSGKFGEVAFGEATAAGQIPQTGSAAYHGLVSGTSDVIGFDSFDGHYNVLVDGSVDLGFDFAKGTLDGSITVSLDDLAGSKAAIGTFAFTNPVFSAGSTTYSGKFDTSTAGANYFLGRFTGPHAEETIGAWALPFVFTHGGAGVQADNQVHQAFGAWIAKRP
jgi:hypothetical protein